MYESEEQVNQDQEIVINEAEQYAGVDCQRQMRLKDANLEKLSKMCDQERKELEVYAVTTGSSVQYSSVHDTRHLHYQLDKVIQMGCWHPAACDIKTPWIQVSLQRPQWWVALVMQGRGDSYNHFVKEIKISYTLNGVTWKLLQNGRVFPACQNQVQKYRIDFDRPVYARTIRIHPICWESSPSLRFDAIYLDFDS